ncbi:ABC transporter permease [Candidatus Woesearchaeota archaeon]|nr:ABC transporter permease [Candidatus Woesearchaeota archaeon]
MVKLFELMKKNFKLLLRSKTSSLVIFIGPLLLVLLLGLAYSQSSGFTLSAAVFSQGYSDLSESLISKMDNQNFNVVRHETQENCVNAVKRGEAQACIVFPPSMHVEAIDGNEVTFYVDYSQINLVWLILDVMSARVSERSEELSKELTADVLDRLWFVEDRMKTGKSQGEDIKTASAEVRTVAGSMKGNVQKLDISVDFSGIDLSSAENATGKIHDTMNAIRGELENLTGSTNTFAGRIDESIAYIEGEVNSSGVQDELDDIDDSIDDIQQAVDHASENIDEDIANASASITAIRAALNTVSLKLDAAKVKIDGVKSQRDDLIPQFEGIDTEIDTLNDKVEGMKATLDEGLERISALRVTSPDRIVAPITTKIEPVTAQKTHFNSLFPTLLVLIIMITGILLSATLVIVEKRSKAFFRNNMTPTSYAMFSLSTYLTSLTTIFIQLVLFVSISAFFFETDVLASVWLLLLIVFLVCTVFICIGMFVGFLFRTEETVNLAAITLATIFLLFSSAVIPLESLPGYIKDIAMFNPFVLSELALKQSLVFQIGVSKLGTPLGMLAGYAAGIFLLLIVLQKLMRKLLFMQFSRPAGPTMIKTKKASKKLTPDREEEEKKHDINELLVKKE